MSMTTRQAEAVADLFSHLSDYMLHLIDENAEEIALLAREVQIRRDAKKIDRLVNR